MKKCCVLKCETIMISHPIFWIFFISIIFWSFYERWDSNKQEYIDHPWRTAVYFIFASAILLFVQPETLRYFSFNLYAIFAFILVVLLTYILYKKIPKYFSNPKDKFVSSIHYLGILNENYIPSKLAEILFQQVFFGSVVSIFVLSNISSLHIFAITVLIFILAHLPFFILQGKNNGAFYLAWSVIGAPLFAYVLLSTNSLWYTISLHLLFYAFLNSFVWVRGGRKQD